MSLAYLATAVALLAVCVFAYIRMTPYRELELVKQGNVAAALSLGGATLGLSLPIGSAIFFTHSLNEMALWAAIGCVMQFILFFVLRKQAQSIQVGNVASGTLLAFLSIATGLLVAMCIS
jgi:putative membrane protein